MRSQPIYELRLPSGKADQILVVDNSPGNAWCRALQVVVVLHRIKISIELYNDTYMYANTPKRRGKQVTADVPRVCSDERLFKTCYNSLPAVQLVVNYSVK